MSLYEALALILILINILIKCFLLLGLLVGAKSILSQLSRETISHSPPRILSL
jgi:hypothetical protein